MELEIELRDSSGQIQDINENISFLALLKHMAIAGQKFIPSIRKFRRIIGMFFRFSDYLSYNAIQNSFFSTPPNPLYDPTEKAHFSNVLGKAIADYLAKKINNAKVTFNYEAAMKLRGIKISDGRPDLIAIINDTCQFAIEAKGFSSPHIPTNKMIEYKNQSQQGPITVSFSVTSVTYNIYSKVKVKYYDPKNKDNPFDKELLKNLSIQYYSGIMEYVNGDLFKIEKIEIRNKIFYKLPLLPETFIKLGSLEYVLPSCLIECPFVVSVLIDVDVKKFAEKGLTEFKKDFIYEDNMYIDRDGIGLMIEWIKSGK